MTLTKDAKTVFDNAGLDRNDALLAAKTLGQQIIDDSASTETPLEGIVYEVWGLYDEGVPACRFQMSDDEEVEYEAYFRTKNGGAQVQRQRTLSLETLTTLIETAHAERPS
jgi:hypothetical protein